MTANGNFHGIIWLVVYLRFNASLTHLLVCSVVTMAFSKKCVRS